MLGKNTLESNLKMLQQSPHYLQQNILPTLSTNQELCFFILNQTKSTANLKKRKCFCWIMACSCSIFLQQCKELTNEKKDTPKPPPPSAAVDAYIVEPLSITQVIEVPGSLAPLESTDLHPEISGRVISINFKEGTNIAKGSLLVKLYDADLQAQLKKIQVQLAIAKKTEERQKQLLNVSGISQQDYDLSLLAVNNLLADITILKTSIEKTEIRAPYAGQLGLRNISLGAYITPSTIISTIRSINQLTLAFTIPERYGDNIKLDGLIHFTIDGSNTNYAATVMATENSIAADTRSLRVKALVTKADNHLISGAFAKVQIELGKNMVALKVPTQAIIPQAKNKKVVVLRNGLASMEIVVTGLRDTSMVEVTSGLKLGDTVLISGLLSTKPGSKVKLNLIKKN